MHGDSLADAVVQRVSDRKVADSRFDSRTGNASLYLWERLSVSYPWDEAVYPWCANRINNAVLYLHSVAINFKFLFFWFSAVIAPNKQ